VTGPSARSLKLDETMRTAMSNRLVSETSPYLLQHADNPVSWWPWCDEAFRLARERDCAVLVSIGYSSCHWCHVMARESFEDQEVGALMNKDFVNIKVDREERPDLDRVYQTAHQALNGSPGGWPLTVFMTPDGMPFFIGTYFPKTSRYRLPGLVDLLPHIAQSYAEKRADIHAQNARLREDLKRIATPAESVEEIDANAVAAELGKLLHSIWDPRHGGFGEAPKFPHASDLQFLLRQWRTEGDTQAGQIAMTTLRHMADGGVFDQLGGGFFRYSVDERWLIPHFEKMLYDNAVLIALYTDAWVLSGEPRFAEVVEQSVEWVLREMRTSEGGFCAALDADTEGEEGRFYVWSRKEARESVAPEAWKFVERHWGFKKPAGFENKFWHVHVAEPLATSARKTGLDEALARKLLRRSRADLLATRERRVRPGRDDKLLAGWNGLMIGALARAARVFDRSDWHEAARAALNAVRAGLWRDGRLYASCRGGPGRFDACLDDYAFLAAGVLELVQADFDAGTLEFARELADALLNDFEDRQGPGGFFFTRHDHEALILRLKSATDESMPSGNGVAVQVLQRLGHLVGEARYIEAADRALRAFGARLMNAPIGCATLVQGLLEAEDPPALWVLQGPEAQAWQRILVDRMGPWPMVVASDGNGLSVPPARSSQGETTARLCQGMQCEAVLTDLDQILERAEAMRPSLPSLQPTMHTRRSWLFRLFRA